MFIVSYTVESNAPTADYYELYDTLLDAQNRVSDLRRYYDQTTAYALYCWAISAVMSASEPHWEQPA